jgi:hypothetical protein
MEDLEALRNDYERTRRAYNEAMAQHRLIKKREAAKTAYHRDPDKVRTRVYLRLCDQGKIANPRKLEHYRLLAGDKRA